MAFLLDRGQHSALADLALAGHCPVRPHVHLDLPMSLRARDREQLEQRLGYEFQDPALLARALTHSSAVAPSRRTSESYQRLEFLGDRVLGLVIAHMLSERMPKSNEGELSRS